MPLEPPQLHLPTLRPRHVLHARHRVPPHQIHPPSTSCTAASTAPALDQPAVGQPAVHQKEYSKGCRVLRSYGRETFHRAN